MNGNGKEPVEKKIEGPKEQREMGRERIQSTHEGTGLR